MGVLTRMIDDHLSLHVESKSGKIERLIAALDLAPLGIPKSKKIPILSATVWAMDFASGPILEATSFPCYSVLLNRKRLNAEFLNYSGPLFRGARIGWKTVCNEISKRSEFLLPSQTVQWEEARTVVMLLAGLPPWLVTHVLLRD